MVAPVLFVCQIKHLVVGNDNQCYPEKGAVRWDYHYPFYEMSHCIGFVKAVLLSTLLAPKICAVFHMTLDLVVNL